MSTTKKILQISPFEPPASGWTKRIKLLREVIQERGGICEVLDIGPSRKIERPGCVCVYSAVDYLRKLVRFSRQGFTFHCHINAEYFRGLLLALAACIVAKLYRNRVLTTFHGGPKQRDFEGWRRVLITPFFRLIFGLSDAIICNSASEKAVLSRYCNTSKIFAIPAFSKQYLDFSMSELDLNLKSFIRNHEPIISTYLCFREGFFTETVIQAIEQLVRDWPRLGLVIVGTGNDVLTFEQKLTEANINRNVHLGGDLDHSSFMTLISKSAIHLRTPITDGVSATVLEALSLRIPVVASENGTRPNSVVTYTANDSQSLSQALDVTLRNRTQVVANLEIPHIVDTATGEVDLLFGNNNDTVVA